MGCGCSKGKDRKLPPYKPSCGCGNKNHGSCKDSCSESCSKAINVYDDNVIWKSGEIPEFGIKNGDKLTEVVQKMARVVSSLKNL